MKAFSPGNRIRRMLPGLLLSAAAIGGLIGLVDWPKTVVVWSQVQPLVLIPAALLTLCSMLTRAMGWRSLMGNKVPMGRCFWVLDISYMLNGILPFRLGDVARAYLISRPDREGVSRITAGAALSAVALERIFDLIFTFVFVLSVFPWIAGGNFSQGMLIASLGLALAGFAAFLALGTAGSALQRAAGRAAEKFPILTPALGPLGHFFDGLKQMRDLRRSLPAFAWIGATMLLWAAEYWLVLRAFFPDAPVYWGLLSLVGGLIGVALPSSPSALGVFEGALTVVLTMAGMASERAAAFAIAIHMFNIILLMALGALGLLAERQSLGSILSVARSAEQQTAE